MTMKVLFVLTVISIFSLSLGQELPYQVPGFPPISPEPTMLEVLEDRGDTVRIRDYYGEIDVPKYLERIVALDEFTLEILLALGITPVGGVHIDSVFPPAYADQTEDVTLIRRTGLDINFEAVLALEPDLLIGYSIPAINETAHPQLRQIAQMLVFQDQPLAYWRQGMRDLAQAFGLEDQAEAVLADYETRVAELREQVSQYIGPDETETILLMFPRSLWLYSAVDEVDEEEEGRIRLNNSTRWAYYDLRLTPSQEVRDVEFAAELSLELLPSLQADHLVVFPGGYETTPAEGYSDFADHPLWQSIPAVDRGNAYELYTGRSNGPLTTLSVIEAFVYALEANYTQARE
jgi:iron complex transport system substrate-binding protein